MGEQGRAPGARWLPGEDRNADQLDDEGDRDELRQRYYGLLQEVRVLLPGVQILIAFLFTIPFDAAFRQLDTTGRDLYGLSLLTAFGAVILFVAPTAVHRLGARRARAERLVWSIRLCRGGLALLGVSLVSGLALVTRDVFGSGFGLLCAVAGSVAVVAAWLVLPALATHEAVAGRAEREVPTPSA
jgi:hypothetical protein